MRIILCENYEEMSEKAASMIAAQLTLKPESVLGLATGSTPVGMYNRLADMNKEGLVDFSSVTTFNLDEYYPINRDNSQSYFTFMNENLFSKINIDLQKTHIPNGETKDPIKECENYEKEIRNSGGIDLQILGIGQNGHIGFNEPDASLNSFTHLTKLTDNTIKANARFFDSLADVPKQAITMGIATIMNAKKIILLASGASKSRVVAELLNDGINTSVPATLLKTHPDVVLICDKDAYLGAKLGVDIGGTNIKFAVVEGVNVKYKNIIDTAKTCEQIVEDISNEVLKLRKEYKIKAVGIGTPGKIKEGCVSAVNLPFDNFALDVEIAKKVGLPVNIDNDGNCAALGEVMMGGLTDCDNIVLVTLGTGVGGGIVMNKSIMHGKNSMGEIGHMIVDMKDGRPCPCGQSGCWEQYASVTALVNDAIEAANDNPESVLNKIYAREGKLNGCLVFEAIDSGCPIAEKVLDTYLDYIAVGVKSLVNIFGPDAVVFAGGITNSGDKFLDLLKAKLPSDLRVEISALQNDAGAFGAAML